MSLSFIPTIMNAIAAQLTGTAPLPADKDSARTLLASFADDVSRQGVWLFLDKEAFCTRIGQLIDQPFLIDQRKLNSCQAAAPLYLMALCYPAWFTHFAIGLFERGEGEFNDLEITLDSKLRSKDFQAVGEVFTVNPIDLLLMVAIRDYQNTFYDIKTLNNLEGDFTSNTMEAEEPLEASGLFDVKPIEYKFENLLAVDKSQPSFLLLVSIFDNLIDVDITTMGSTQDYLKQSKTPHSFVALPEIEEKGVFIEVKYWSWGVDPNPQAPPPSAQGWRTRAIRKSAVKLMGTNVPYDGDGFHVIPTGIDAVT